MQVGSFNFDNRKMVFENYLLPVMPNHTKSILDYDVQIRNLRPEATFFVPAETGKQKQKQKKEIVHSSFIATFMKQLSHSLSAKYTTKIALMAVIFFFAPFDIDR